MRNVVMLVMVSAAMSGCLAHERAVEETDASSTPPILDAFVGRDAGPIPDAGQEARPVCSLLMPLCAQTPGPPYTAAIELDRVACPGHEGCVTIEVDGRDALNDPSAACARPESAMQGSPVAVERCAHASTFTSLRITTLEVGATPGGWFTTPSVSCPCAHATLAAAVGESVDVDGVEHPEGGLDSFRFFGAGSRFRIEACARTHTSPCP
jgi:hypothetical protein